jgi:valyl-tRNA synthetase
MESERARLQKELDDTLAQIERLDTLLSGSFGQRAPAAVVEKERQKLAAFQETAARLKEQLANR